MAKLKKFEVKNNGAYGSQEKFSMKNISMK